MDVVVGQRVDRDQHRLAGAQPRELRLLEVGVDIDVVERNQAREPLAGLHVVAGLHRAVADHTVERRADDGERQIALGLGQRGLQFVERAGRFLLLALEDFDIGGRGVDGGLCALHGGTAWSRLACACSAAGGWRILHGERVLALEFELRARGRGLAETSCAFACATAAFWASI